MKQENEYSRESLKELTSLERKRLLKSLEEAYLVVTEMGDRMMLLKSDIVKIIGRLK